MKHIQALSIPKLPASGPNVCANCRCQRRIASNPKDVYTCLMHILEGDYTASKMRHSTTKKAYSYPYKYAKYLSVNTIEHPVTGITEKRFMFTDEMINQAVIVLQCEEKCDCISCFYQRT